jgi:hypothetical protein
MRRSPIERFEAKYSPEPNTGCWLWMGATTASSGGYGLFGVATAKARLAHRWIWEQRNGQVPEGLELDHKCRQRLCVNPEHLEPVTRLENIRRGLPWRSCYQKTHCKKGHPYDVGAISDGSRAPRGRVKCRTCANAASVRSVRKHRERANAAQRAYYHALSAEQKKERRNRARKRAG